MGEHFLLGAMGGGLEITKTCQGNLKVFPRSRRPINCLGLRKPIGRKAI